MKIQPKFVSDGGEETGGSVEADARKTLLSCFAKGRLRVEISVQDQKIDMLGACAEDPRGYFH